MAGPESAAAAEFEPVLFAHKPDCNDRLEARKEAVGELWGSEELSRLPLYLENSLHVDRASPLAYLF